MPMKKTKLQQYFPVFKTKLEIREEINENPHLKSIFLSWNDEEKSEFLAFCTGQRGMKILYDAFFKEVFNPEYSVERLDNLLSVIIGRKVHIIQILPIDSTRMGDEASLVAMDMVVELEDKTLINVEMQKIGYLFPGERSACYSSDLVLRQYKRIRDKSTVFSYKKLHPVYSIIFFEKSPSEFDKFPNDYIHIFEQKSNTGLALELLQKYIFISLDNFTKEAQNITNELEAWLLFLSSDKPEDIIFLIEKYPWFKPLYDTLFNMCQNIEGVMDMFSKELYEMDKNTELLMVDEFSKRNEELKKKNAELKKEHAELEKENAELGKENAELEAVSEKMKQELKEKQVALKESETALKEKQVALKESETALQESQKALEEKDALIAKLQAKLAEYTN